jgi:lysozyme family protein
MKGNFEQCLALVLKHEGGYVDHPKDPGGATNLGCTKKVWEEWVGHEVTKDDIKALKIADVAPLYKARYWDKCRCDDLPFGVDFSVFDLAINSGPARASKYLQTACGANADGVIGPATLSLVNSQDPLSLLQKINDNRLQFLQSLPTWETFGKGWGRRVAEVKSASTSMVG